MFRGSVRVLATHSIRQFPLHFPSRASPCAIRFQAYSTARTYLSWLTASGSNSKQSYTYAIYFLFVNANLS